MFKYLYINVIKTKRIERGSSRFEIEFLNNYTGRSDRRIFPKLEPLDSFWKDLSNDVKFVMIQRLDFQICVNQICRKTAPWPCYGPKRRLNELAINK